MSAPASNSVKAGRWALNGFAGLALLYLFAPILWIVVFSFNRPASKYNIEWRRFTWKNWPETIDSIRRGSALTDALGQSLQVALIATLVATVFGSLIALSLSRYRFRGAAALNLFLVLPLTTPEIVLGSSLLTLFIDWDWARGFRTVVIAHIMFQISFVALTVRARVRGFDWTLEQAAADLGAGPLRTFWKVTFPLILPGIAAAALLSFALSIDDFIITFFNAGNLQTFPLYVNGSFTVQFPAMVNVLSTLLLLVCVGLTLVGVVWGARRTSGA
ncbi:ABC transporter permease [soil metagenome]